ncbi:NAD(P)H-dependent oxidoreductase [Thalassotalea fonticola]|uniref:NAD(P)H-dependent oxidoreductase n=1 Tax=Thalassotalea fonticola TaxID=3065649 RepID=A0ABZ0GM51_9GAMM|nr:NAD(P)H-dependent oxidoreductase [Colwelliaceae bacterium S1-1]
MKNALLVTAHPYTESFNFTLRTQAIELLNKFDWQVNTSDLYQQGFNPILGPADFPNISASVPLSLPKQQEIAHQQALFSNDISSEQSKLLDANLLILQFPLWWGSYPAILKGWIERVISRGYGYGSNNLLSGKRVLLSVTTGGANDDDEIEYYQKKIQELGVDVFPYAKMEVLKPIINHGPSHSNEKQRKNLLSSSKNQLISLLSA